MKELIEDKVYSLTSLIKFSESPLEFINLFKIYLTKRGNLTIKIMNSNILVNKDNVHGFIRLVRNLSRCDVNEEILSIFIKDKLSINEIINNEHVLQLLKALCIIKKLNAKVEDLGNKALIDLPDTKWLIRKNTASWDLLQGPLLPYLHEPYEYSNWFYKKLSHVSCFVDIGANIGGYSVRACINNPYVDVYSFEPDPENYNILTTNLSLNKCNRAKTYDLALGDSNAILPLYQPDITHMGSLSLCREGILRGYVTVKPLDEVLNLESPCIVKIDVEGFELKVLKGMVNNLSKIKFLIIETNDKDTITKFLNKYGFKLVDHHSINYFYARRK